ncbi:beta-ketoacyl-ACP reductase [Agaricicola taiwanensis]|uniref:Beta-ketoacyl-ACP reductase n=1 Tax=Agaricicola taiwanensis TaxID=591372 RepID=A0A8J2VKB1_9RHOB|nr:SDR family oxidoreductase [Agaricicola taiwanensis]GGE27990.1 beta-ketoacyl-ACP reductase [Agaricicola taiwanensis]
MSDKTLAGKTAFVSGSGRNIGRAVAVGLARLGCNVIVNGATSRESCEQTAALVEAQGARALIAMGDMRDPKAISGIADRALGEFHTVDILVNNAAVRPHSPFLGVKEEDWQAVVDTSLTAAFRTSQAFLPGMVQKGWGRIVSMTGMKSIQGYFEGAHISAAKHGIWGLTKALATEFGPKGITVNAVSPGQTLTEGGAADDPKKLAGIPVGFMAEPEDIAAVVTFLASPQARFVNGQMIAANGGQTT